MLEIYNTIIVLQARLEELKQAEKIKDNELNVFYKGIKEELLDKIDILDSLLSSTVKVEKVPETVRLSSPEEVEEYEQKGLIKENNQGYFSVLNYIEKKEIEEQNNIVYEVITEDGEYFKYFIIENAEEGDSVDMHTIAGNYLLK